MIDSEKLLDFLREQERDMRAAANEDEANSFTRLAFRSKAETYALVIEEVELRSEAWEQMAGAA